MDFLSRLLGTTPSKANPKGPGNDPEVRLAKFKRLYHTVLSLCNRPRNLSTEGPLLEQLHGCLQRIDAIVREESRAPAPHLSLQFAASNRIYTVIARAATASQNEAVIQASVSILAALVDSEEEDFVSNVIFAKSLMRLVTRVVDGDSDTLPVNISTETAILELLFTIAAKIRLQPYLLPSWFHASARPELDDDALGEKQDFVGFTQKNDFPLCYLLVDRVHREGRVGDFARTGLLYIFEATGRSPDLEEWIVSSDLPTLMATGLGALYSQLSRELSILHPDATLPAVLAMSDYSTTHPRATAESAFSDRHRADMATFLSYLTFWQDVLDHCRSADVKRTLLDHFQILFLQQLLYPSLLQSSDIDAGSSVAVLTYMNAMLESLERPDLISMMLEYLLAVKTGYLAELDQSVSSLEPPRSPTSMRKRQSLLTLTASQHPDDEVEPALFSLVDLILNNVRSPNPQSAFAALKLATTILARQRNLALGTILKVEKADYTTARTIGALEVETEEYTELATSLHNHSGLEDAYIGLAEDARTTVEAQVPFQSPTLQSQGPGDVEMSSSLFILSRNGAFLRASIALLQTFFSNSIDVNLALTQTFISIAACTAIRLDPWLALDPARYTFDTDEVEPQQRPWAAGLEVEEQAHHTALQQSSRRPVWPEKQHQPTLYSILQGLLQEVNNIRVSHPNLDHLISVRKT
ncbi:Retinoic acid induced 16-like protein-domain-containing protein, partial [Neohortaea acidophila]